MSQNIPLKLRDWIDEDQIRNYWLSMNPNAIQYLEKNPDVIDWVFLTENPNCVSILEQNLDKMVEMRWYDLFKYATSIFTIEKYLNTIPPAESYWSALSGNPVAMQILKKNPDKISIRHLCFNTHPDAIKILEENYDKINWNILCSNPSAISLIERRLSEPYIQEVYFLDFRSERPYKNINWDTLAENPNALHILEQNKDKIGYNGLCNNPNIAVFLERNPDVLEDIIRLFPSNKQCFWYNLSKNPAPGVMEIFEKHPDKIHWAYFTENPSAIELLEQNQDKINYKKLAKNPAIFVYDYRAMRESYKELKEELMKAAWHPRRIHKWLELEIDLEDL
jgi:hypothetical protein